MNNIKNLIIKFKSTILRWLKSFLQKRGYLLSSVESSELVIKFYEKFRNQYEFYDSGIISLVFSKDRAMQLHAFLGSYFENIGNYSNMIVLYKASSDNHLNSYHELEKIFANLPVTFIEEFDFRSQLINIITQFKERKIIFYVDDIIFTQKFDYEILKNVNPYNTIVALSRGRDMIYSIVLSKMLRLPKLTKLNNCLLQFAWNDITELSDWSYPLGVSGYMYATKEILSILKTISFNAPNSLENSMQKFLPIYKNRFGVCTENAIAVCVHANLTQTEGKNYVLGIFSIEELLEKWNKGYQIDYTKFYYKPMSVTQEQNYTFYLR